MMKKLLFAGQGDPVEKFPYFSSWGITKTEIAAVVGHADESFDAVFTSLALNRLPFVHVPQALAACWRVLKADGFFLASVPSLEWALEHLNSETERNIALECIYGPASFSDKATVAFHSGFNREILRWFLVRSPFRLTNSIRSPLAPRAHFILAQKTGTSQADLDRLRKVLFPNEN